MPTSPDVLNYHIGKATVSFTPEGGSLRQLGNAPEIEITPELETLPHFSSQSGIRTKDREVNIEASATLRLVLDEITPENLAMLLLGTVDTATAGNWEFNILAITELKGEVVITGTNDVGNRFTITLPSVNFTPSGSFSPISDEWNQIELTGEILAVGGIFGNVEETLVAT
jgi:hypothetical protein